MKDIEYLEKYVSNDNIKEAKERLKQGEPVQYIVGSVSFYGYDIKVNNNVLIPRFETEELVENTINLIKSNFQNKKINILEIGTGSGCISIALKKELGNVNIIATDISEKALEVAKNNAKLNNVDINFIKTDLFEGIKDKFDVIISNPPYISKEEKIMDVVYNNEPHVALFAPDNGLYFYNQILSKCKKILNKKYLIAFEIGETQAKQIEKYAENNLPEAKISLKKDLQGRDRMIFINNFE